MGNGSSLNVQRATFDEVREGKGLLISVLDETDQRVLVKGTVPCGDEVGEVERAIREKQPIVIYGKNAHDDKIWLKYKQLTKLGGSARVYVGGLFEWLLLHEVYGSDAFPLTTPEMVDLYQYRPK
jgi:hypothetical protein